MYGIVPMIQSKKKGKAPIGAMIWANASDTFVDIYDAETEEENAGSKRIHWMSEAGALEVFLISSETPQQVS